MTPRAIDLVVSERGVARYRGRRFPCSVGKHGFIHNKKEGDGRTPVGVFHIESVRFRPDRVSRVRLGAPLLQTRTWDGWSDDSLYPDYNQLIRRPYPGSHEALRRPDPLYDVLAVLSANRNPVVPGKGSAIFLHVWRRTRFPTAGCIAFPRAALLWILSGWSSKSRIFLGR